MASGVNSSSLWHSAERIGHSDLVEIDLAVKYGGSRFQAVIGDELTGSSRLEAAPTNVF